MPLGLEPELTAVVSLQTRHGVWELNSSLYKISQCA